MRYDFPIAYVRELRIRCDKIGVKSTPDFWKTSPLRLTEVFNEIGPEHWCPQFEKLVKYLVEPFFVAALQHDWEASRPYKSWSAFTAMNLRFIYNALQEAIEQKTLKLVFMGILLAMLCQLFGYKTYLQTFIPEEK